MRIITREIQLPEGRFEAEFLEFENSDRRRLREIYENWRNLNTMLGEIQARSINLPEGLSESAFCIARNTLRLLQNIPGANSSWDCFDPANNRRLQIKACSVIPDLTSFGPRSQWDDLYFLDFYRYGQWDGTFDIYQIPTNLIYNFRINNNQTFRDQQNQGRRPRLSIWSNIIQPNNIQPIQTYQL